MRVMIITSWGHKFSMELSEKEGVVEMKKKIQEVLGVPIASQILAVCEWELMDGLDMEDYPIITQGTNIELTIKCLNNKNNRNYYNSSCRKIQITIKLSARRQLHIEVDGSETVGSLKEKIHIMDGNGNGNGTPIKRMSLFYGGIELDQDFRNLSEYGVCESSEMVVFLKGGSRIKEEAPARNVSVVVKTSSSLVDNDAAMIPVEVKDSSTVDELRQLLLRSGMLPIREHDYLFIHKQRMMRDHCSLRWHGVDDGDFLHVFKGTP